MKIKDMILISMFAGLTAIGAHLSIPLQPVPFTLQLLFCIYSGVLLGAKRGALSQLVYLLLGLAGLPIFAGGTGGIGIIASPTFGFILGFILCSYVAGTIAERFEEINIFKLILASTAGIVALYIVAIPYFYLIFNNVLNIPTTFVTTIKTAVLPFILQDLVKGVLVAATSLKVIPILRKAGHLEIKEDVKI